MNILLTGGTGYIGSHTAIVLSEAKHEVVILDNFCNSSIKVLDRLKKILGKNISCIEGDVRETSLVIDVLRSFKIDAVIHFAGLKAVGESVKIPLDYYANNVQGTVSLVEAMKLCCVKHLVFSSSATVYGDPQYLPIDEDHPTSATNPYGRSKLHIEEMLRDIADSDISWRIACLRYFNPVGAHESGLIGENPRGNPNNLMPYIAQVASGKKDFLNIFGNDYDTKDGTGVRDYIHVMDLSEGHVAALGYLCKSLKNFSVFNLGTGEGSSVLDLVNMYQSASHKRINFKIGPRRPGDISTSYADINKARVVLNWVSRRSLRQMCEDSWRWECLPVIE